MADNPRTRADARRRGRGGRRAKPRPRRILRKLLLGFVVLVALGIAGVVAAYLLVDIPKPNDRAVSQASVLYYSDGETEMDRIATVNRESVDIDQVPASVQQAFIAAEDRSFYENRGISPKGIFRAVSGAVSGEDRGGGSTITQQYVKNYFLTQDQTYSRKAKEILISVKIDGELGKDEILENYLNTIYFGRGADGIQTASEEYFGKDVEDLSVSEGALLASIIRGPSLYDPTLGEDQRARAEERWNYVLDGMVEKGWMTASERAEQEFPEAEPPKRSEAKASDIGFITEEVRGELRDRLDLSDAQIDRGGYKIVTTIDKDAQKAAAKSVKEHRPTGKRTSDLHIGLASIEPGDGAVRAMYGGDRFGEGKYGYFNSAVDGKMQAGSTMKPFTMIAALRKGIPLSTTYSGASPYYNKAYIYDGSDASATQRRGGIVNYGGTSYGPVSMTTATQKSVNTYYAQLNLAADPKSTAASAKDAGVIGWKGDKKAKLSTGPGNVFGTDAVRVLDMANAYATIAAEGRRAEPYYISQITTTGDSDFEYEVEKDVERAFPKDVARDTIQAMSHVGESGGTAPMTGDLGRPIGGKTGTTSDNYAAWFDGFTPGQMATAVGMYKGDGRLVKKNQLVNMGEYAEVTGGTIPAQIWTDYMTDALKGEPVKKLPPPGNVKYKKQTKQRSDAPAPITSSTSTRTRTSEPTSTRTSSSSTSSSSSSSTSERSSSTSSSSSSSSSESSSSTSESSSSSETSSSSSSTSRPTSSTSRPTSTSTTRPPSSTSTSDRPSPTRTTRPSSPSDDEGRGDRDSRRDGSD